MGGLKRSERVERGWREMAPCTEGDKMTKRISGKHHWIERSAVLVDRKDFHK